MDIFTYAVDVSTLVTYFVINLIFVTTLNFISVEVVQTCSI
jgi:hypothetical protein